MKDIVDLMRGRAGDCSQFDTVFIFAGNGAKLLVASALHFGFADFTDLHGSLGVGG